MATILIVDDSSIIRRNLRRILESEGHYIVAEAEDGQSGVEKYKENKVDLVTMDIQMPGLNGIGAVTQIKAYDPHAKIIMISSVEQRDMVFQAIKEGAKHYIVKPFDETKVVEVIQGVLKGGDKRHEENQIKANKAVSSETSQPGPVKYSINPEVEPPFHAAMKDGKIIITIIRQLTDKNFAYLQMLFEGLQPIRQSKVVIIFEEVPLLYDHFWTRIIEFIRQVKQKNGLFAAVCDDQAQHTLLKSKLGIDVYKDYDQIGW